MSDPTYTETDRRNTLLIVRVIWFMLVLGQVGFGAVVVWVVQTGGGGDQGDLKHQMLAIGAGALIGAIVLGYFVRNQSYKQHWVGHAVTPAGFFQGNLVLLGLLEMASFLSLVFVMLSGVLFPVVLPAVASLAVQCANFPSGGPMQASLPDMVRDEP